MEPAALQDLLPRRLKAARALAGLEAAGLAEACGWSVDKIWRFERGDQVPNALELAALARHTNQSVAYFIDTEAAA